jgi:hypothetical protein
MLRRTGPRIAVDSLCSEVVGHDLRNALVVDLSEDGIRIQRPIGGPRTRSVQIELEIPGLDELVWAAGEICFDEVWRVPSGITRTSGVRLIAAAQRHRRILREYVEDTWRFVRAQSLDVGDLLGDASCYLRG